jgi:hypothetical protein
MPHRATSPEPWCGSRPTDPAPASGSASWSRPQGAAVHENGAIYVSNYSVLPRNAEKAPPINGTSGTLVKITR